MDLKKILSITVISILVANLALFAVFRYSWIIFWGILLAGFIATLVLKERNQQQ